MSRCVIISAGEIRDYQRSKRLLLKDDFFILCDGGLSHLESLAISPDIIVGDFDSCLPSDLERFSQAQGKKPEIIRLPGEKDDTDTFYAVKLAIERGFDDFLFLGMMGARFDHALGNISCLLYLHEKGKKAVLADDYSCMRVVADETYYIKDSCSYFSVLTIAGSVSGVNIKNAKYPLENASLSSDFQLGISNEVLPGKVAEVSVKNGRVLVVEVEK